MNKVTKFFVSTGEGTWEAACWSFEKMVILFGVLVMMIGALIPWALLIGLIILVSKVL